MRGEGGRVLTLGSLEVNDGVVILEHVHFVNVLQLLHAYTGQEVGGTYRTS